MQVLVDRKLKALEAAKPRAQELYSQVGIMSVFKT